VFDAIFKEKAGEKACAIRLKLRRIVGVPAKTAAQNVTGDW
jgi:hypothetical protein